MKKFKTLLLLAVLTVVPSTRAVAQQLPPLPIDTAVRIGKLSNGLTYYIRHNALPKERANFYIAQKVGSVQEDDNQRGLAHFLEHMCFNGTDHFPGDRLTKYCESIGVKFGVNLNAYTSTDETVYNIDDVPVTPANVDSCLLILRDWADGLTLDPKEIDKERGVINEEWRLRTSGSSRIFERNLPALYPNSKYGHRYPIGLMEIINNFKPQALRDYYEKWYRPDLQGIIIVGDINVDEVEASVKRLFGSIKMPANPAAYETYSVPANTEPVYIIDKDKEVDQKIIQMIFKHEPFPTEYKNTTAYLAQGLVLNLATTMLNARLGELSQQPDCPFIGAGCNDGKYLFSKTMDAFSVTLIPKPDQDTEAVKAVMEEIERAARFGFTTTELIRSREELLSRYEQIYDNRDKQKNDFYVPQYVRNFLENDPIPSLETEFNLYKQLAPMLPVEAVSETFKALTASTDTNFVFLAFYPEKEGVTIPTADSFKAAITAAKAAELTAYVDNVKDEPLVAELPAKGKIVKEAKADFGYTCWTLSNGARVYWRQTDFNDSQVLMNARSLGGYSKVADSDLVNAKLIGPVTMFTGIGNFSAVELEKKLAGKQASVSPSLSNFSESLSGNSTPKDLRTLFELTYLRFQAPADDEAGYNNCIQYLRSALENVEKVPEQAFSDSVRATLYNHNIRAKELKYADLDQANYDAVRRIYRERFNSASDFDFYFTGNFNTDSLRAYTEQFLASLPAAGAREKYANVNMRPRKGAVVNRFSRQMETPKGNFAIIWTGDLKYSLKNSVILDAVGQVLTSRYLKSIREDRGLAYTVGAAGSADYGVYEQYSVQVQCPVKPEKCDSALLLVDEGLQDLAKNGATAEELQKIKEYELKNFADQQRTNAYWQGLILAKSAWNIDEQKDFEKIINDLTSDDLKNFINKHLLKDNNRVSVIMLPEENGEQQ